MSITLPNGALVLPSDNHSTGYVGFLVGNSVYRSLKHTRNPWHTLLKDERMRVMCALCGKMFGLHQQAADHWLTDHHTFDLIARKVT